MVCQESEERAAVHEAIAGRLAKEVEEKLASLVQGGDSNIPLRSFLLTFSPPPFAIRYKKDHFAKSFGKLVESKKFSKDFDAARKPWIKVGLGEGGGWWRV